MNYKIVSDSSSNIFDLPGANYAYVPLKINADGKEYVDTPDLDVGQMIEDLKKVKGPSGTSCPNVLEWSDAFDGADAAFAVTISSNLSGSCSAAMQAADEKANIFVVDSLSAGAEMQLIIEKLHEHIQSGMEYDAICRAITEYQKHTKLIFCLESLNNLARNGRVGMATAKIAGVLGIRIVGKASDVGTLEPQHKCRGERKALSTIWEDMQKEGYHGGKVRINHCMNEAAAQQLKFSIHQTFPEADVAIVPCTALCSFYAEEGGLIIGYEA